MASIHKNAGKRGTTYRVQWRDPSGRQTAKSFKRYEDARVFARHVEADKDRGVYRDPKAGRITFKEYAEQWRELQVCNPTTREAVESRLRKHVYPHIGSTPLAALTPTKIQALVKALELTPAERPKKGVVPTAPRTLSPRYIGTIMTTVKTVLNAAVADNRIPRNPANSRSVRTPTVVRRKVVPWTDQQVETVKEAIADPYGIVITLASGLGLRQGEVFGLAVEDVDFLGGWVHVRRQVKVHRGNVLWYGLPKGDKTRDVPLPTHVQEALAQHLAANPAQPCALPWGDVDGPPQSFNLVLTSRERKPVNRNHFNGYVLKPAVSAAGLPPTRDNMTHALRHWYASVLLDAGESIRTVADYLGHSDPSFTLRTYAHLMPESAERTRKAVDNAFSGAATASRVDESLTNRLEGQR